MIESSTECRPDINMCIIDKEIAFNSVEYHDIFKNFTYWKFVVLEYLFYPPKQILPYFMLVVISTSDVSLSLFCVQGIHKIQILLVFHLLFYLLLLDKVCHTFSFSFMYFQTNQMLCLFRSFSIDSISEVVSENKRATTSAHRRFERTSLLKYIAFVSSYVLIETSCRIAVKRFDEIGTPYLTRLPHLFLLQDEL